jgi:hypothetical protein
MHSSTSPFLAIVGLVLLITSFVSFRMRPAKPSRIAFVAAVSPGILMLVLFYSLVIHMHQSLGAWPTSIGERGFPTSLIIHDSIAGGFFYILLLVTFFIWPIVFLLCLLVRRWRACVYYIGVYGLASAVCFAATSLAPTGFLDWLWD